MTKGRAMSKIKIKFLEDGSWMDEPGKPIFEVKAGEIVPVTALLAKTATDARKAVFLGEGQISLNSPEDAEKFASLLEREEEVSKRESAADELEGTLVKREDSVSELEKMLNDDKSELDKREEALNAKEKTASKKKAGPRQKAEG